MLGLLLALFVARQTPTTYHLTTFESVGGSFYACGASVLVRAQPFWYTLVSVDGGPKTLSAKLTFDHWEVNSTDPKVLAWFDTIWSLQRQSSMTITMPCFDVILVPNYR
jgi:hypothetical protein